MLLILQLQLWLTWCVASLVAAGVLVPVKPGVVSLRVQSSTALALQVTNTSTAPFVPTYYNVYLFSPTSVNCDASAVSGGMYRRNLNTDANAAAAVRSLFTTPVRGQSPGSSLQRTENVDSLDTCMALCVATGAACKAVTYWSNLKNCYQLDRTYDSLFVSRDDSHPCVVANKLTEANVKSFALLSSGAHCSSFTNLRVAGYWTDGGTIEQCYIAMMTYKDEVGVGCNGQTFQYHSGSGDCGCGKDTCVSQTSDVAWNVYRTYEEKVKCLYQISASRTGVLLAPNASTGVYTADVYACNDQGCSTDYVTTSTTFPGPPKSVEVRVAGEKSLSMKIEPPEDDGGANISHYEVTICPVIYGDNLVKDGTFEKPDAGQAWKEHNSPTFAGIVDGFSRFNTRSYRVEADNKACGGEQVISVQLGDHMQISTWTNIESFTGVATLGDWPAYVRVFDNSTGPRQVYKQLTLGNGATVVGTGVTFMDKSGVATTDVTAAEEMSFTGSGSVDTGLNTHASNLRTVSFWIKIPNKDTGYREIVAKSTWGQGFEVLLLDGKIRAYLMDATKKNDVFVASPNVLENPNVWTHVAATHEGNGGMLRLYINGEEVGSKLGPSNIGDPGGNIKIGTWTNANSRFFVGVLKKIELFTVTLNPAEILNIFDGWSFLGSNRMYGPMKNWDMTLVTDLNHLFYQKKTLNSDLSKWDVSGVTTMQGST